MSNMEKKLDKGLTSIMRAPLLQVREIIYELKEVLNESEKEMDIFWAERLSKMNFQSVADREDLEGKHKTYRDSVHLRFKDLIKELEKEPEYITPYIIKHLVYAIYDSEKDKKDYWADKLNQVYCGTYIDDSNEEEEDSDE